MDPGALLTDLLKQLATIAAQQALQEIKLIVGVDEEVQKLQASFEKVQAMLNNAEERQQTDEAVKLWFNDLKDAYYMMDDVLDKWKTAMIKSKIQKAEEEAAGINTPAVKKKVCSFFPSPSCCFRQVDNLALRREIGHKIDTLNGTLDKILKDKVTYGFDLTRQPLVVERPKTTCFVDVSNIIGRDNHKTDLLSNLLGEGSLEERKPRVISLVGMGGLGKTALAQLAYNDPKVKAHFEKMMWVCVSDPFDQCRVAKAICQELDPDKTHYNNITELQTLLTKIHDMIGDKKFLLVLDDVWTEVFTVWEPFKLVLENGAPGSRILVTTRKQRVAEIMGSVPMIRLELLSNEDCWLIFSKIAFSNEDQCKDLETLGRELTIKCKGLPLAVKTLGNLMQTKRSREQWKNILDSIFWELENFNEGILPPLLLSYYDLPLTTRHCFSFCAAFPKDHNFHKDELVLLWMAQGYINSETNMEIKAEEYFDVLAMRSFFQDFEKDGEDGGIVSCKMHDIVHDFAQSMTKNECFTVNGDKEFRIDCKSARHLSLIVKETFPVKVHEATNLRFLDMKFSSSHTVLPNLFQHLTCVRTLILEGESIVKLPNEVEKLIHLRFLKLCKTHIVELPETICNLCNLQTLNFTSCEKLEKLPQGMVKLINLRHLIIDGSVITSYPKEIGRLSSLRTFCGFVVGDKDDAEGFKLEYLKNLNHLRGNFAIGGLGNMVDVRDAENAQLKKKIHLHALVLWFSTKSEDHEKDEDEQNRRMNNDALVLNALEPHPDLEGLKIGGYIGPIMCPNWMMSLTKLKKLHLFSVEVECLPSLGKLPSLEFLSIVGSQSLKKVGVEFLGIESKNKKDDNIIFPKLKSLHFWMLNEWEEWNGIGGEEEEEDNCVTLKIMPRLHRLRIALCPKLKSLPGFLRTTPLMELTITQSPILSQRVEREDWPKLHIPNIQIADMCVQREGFDFSTADSTGECRMS